MEEKLDLIFAKYDYDKDGELDEEEMNSFISDFFADADVSMQYFKFEVQDMIQGMDKSGDFLINREELKEFLRRSIGMQQQMA